MDKETGNHTETYSDTIDRLKEQNKVILEALAHIANPIKALQDMAEKSGGKLDGNMAVTLHNDASYLKEIAREAIKRAEGK